MKPLSKAVDDYLELRRGLGFKLVRHEAGLRDFVSFLGSKRERHITVAWPWSGRPNMPISNPLNGRRGSALCAVLPATGVQPIP